MLAICDDFNTHSSIGQTFNAVVTNVASLQGEVTPSTAVKFDHNNPADPASDAAKQQTDYATAAYLAIQLLGIDQSTAAGKTSAGLYSFALWSIFTPSALTKLTPTEQAGVQNILNGLTSANLTPGAYGNVDIYTPSPQSASQEFIVVRTDEPGAVALLGFNILAVFSLVFFLRKRLIRAV
ncbi:MAG: hypothetical protein PGMFKBFP_02459 [Anaerolineales bacterium]|nr:hypothetical protein [Anaerolineales bacterium]